MPESSVIMKQTHQTDALFSKR